MQPQPPLVIYVSKMETTTGTYFFIRSDIEKPWRNVCQVNLTEEEPSIKNEKTKEEKVKTSKKNSTNGTIKKKEVTEKDLIKKEERPEKDLISDITGGILAELLLQKIEISVQQLIFKFDTEWRTESTITYTNNNEGFEVTDVIFFQSLSPEEMRYFFIAQRNMQEETLSRRANVKKAPIILK